MKPDCRLQVSSVCTVLTSYFELLFCIVRCVSSKGAELLPLQALSKTAALGARLRENSELIDVRNSYLSFAIMVLFIFTSYISYHFFISSFDSPLLKRIQHVKASVGAASIR